MMKNIMILLAALAVWIGPLSAQSKVFIGQAMGFRSLALNVNKDVVFAFMTPIDQLDSDVPADVADDGPEPDGEPLTYDEKSALLLHIRQCWNVGVLSSEALRTTVIVGVSMTKDARPITDSIKMLSSFGGSGEAAAKQAYEAARRAIIRCGSTGYDLPRDKYERWRHIEITFNPEKMRIK